MSWPCFMIEETTRGVVYLRRYATMDPNVPARPRTCVGKYGYHNALVTIFSGEYKDFGCSIDEKGRQMCVPLDRCPPHDDPRWPRKCDYCDAEFYNDDEWQVGWHILWRAPDGREFMLREAPVGSMWHARWFAPFKHHNKTGDPRGPLHVMLPNGGGEWNIDGPSSNGDGWTRTGTPPHVTAQPSILVPTYHSYLQNGVLGDPV